MNIFNILFSTLFPNVCIGCGTVISEGEFFCDYCREMSEFCQADKICLKCGLPKDKCECKKYVYHFDSCVAPYRYSGPTKKAMFAFKFRHKAQIGRFFTEKMALAVLQNYYDNKFDFITFVPMLRRDELKRGYNQAELLAKVLSDILHIPVKNVLIQIKSKPQNQHKLDKRLRFDNIKGLYICEVDLSGKNILLVDDIKTTGATLNECSKQLLSAGAESVSCVTALITYNDKKKGKK